ncbi:MAG: Rab family GTPase [Candidatus Thorarchaeota archaeon]
MEKKTEVEKTDYSLKVILIGDGGTGKTSLVNQFVHRKFTSIYKTTIGVDITPYKTAVKETGENARFVLWDMSGQTHFEKFRSRFYTGSSGALVVYDLTNAQSYRNVGQWIKECQNSCNKAIPITLVGNKADLDELQILHAKPPMLDYPTVITSAKNNWNVEKAFFSLFERILGHSLVKQEVQEEETTHLSFN